MAAGDRGAAERALSFVFDKQQRPDGSIRQNTFVDGTPHWDGTQQDEVAFPIVLAWQLHRDDAQTYAQHVKPAADWLVRTGPQSDMDRWENQSGWSPGTIASEIAGLICAADLARRNGDDASAATYEQTADTWQKSVESWTATTNGPYSDKPYYLRVTKDANPERRQHLLDRRQRAERRRRAHGRRPELPRARAARRQEARRPDDPQLDRRRRPAARGRHPQRALLAPRQLRRLRGAARRPAVELVPGRHPRHPRPRVADLRRRARGVQPARRAARPTPSWPRWRAPPTRAA